MADDAANRRVLVSSNTQRNGCSLYSVPLERFAAGGLTLDDLEPTFTYGGRNVVVLPAKR